MRTRALARFLLLLLASFGPLAPVVLGFLLAGPPLIEGPGPLAAAREFFDEKRRH